MLQSSITAWLNKPATVTRANDPRRATSIAAPSSARQRDNDPPALKKPAATLPSTPPLPANVELAPLTHELLPAFKRILGLTLPVAYPNAFFAESMEEPFHSITLMALWHPAPLGDAQAPASEKPRLVGAIRCRILPQANLYISTISLLAPYRSHGIATHLLQTVAAKAIDQHAVRCVTAHVWEANEEGLEWYKKRGFDIIGKEDVYYHKLKPPGAILVRKWIGVAELLAHPDQVSRFDR